MGKLSDLRMTIVKNGESLPYPVNPYAVKDFSDFYREGKSRFMCSCGLLYELRHGDNALIPVSRKTDTLHEDTCPLSERYRHNEKALIFDPQKGTLVASITGDISRRPEYGASHVDIPRKNVEGEHTTLSPYGLIRRVNLLSLYYEYENKRSYILNGSSGNYPMYYLAEKFTKFVYSSARTVNVSGHDSVICGTSLEKDGYDFFYRPVKGIEVTFRDKDNNKHTENFVNCFSLDDFYTLSENAGIEAPERFDKDTSKLFIRLLLTNSFPLRVSYPALKHALKHLKVCFTAGEVDFLSDSVIAAGWRYPDKDSKGNIKKDAKGRIFPVADRLTLLNVNRYGVISESGSESNLMERIIRMVNKSPDLIFFKPFVLTDDFYYGRWLPRGVIQVRNAKKDVIVEIFDSMRSGEYLDKIRCQEPDKHIYLTWFPSKEPLESFEDKLKRTIREEIL